MTPNARPPPSTGISTRWVDEDAAGRSLTCSVRRPKLGRQTRLVVVGAVLDELAVANGCEVRKRQIDPSVGDVAAGGRLPTCLVVTDGHTPSRRHVGVLPGPLHWVARPAIIAPVRSELILDSGLRIVIVGRPPQGTKHQTLFGIVPETQELVAVKLKGVPGALDRERAALEYLTARAGPVPKLRASGFVGKSGRRVACLVMERKPGTAPTSRAGWRRMGQALGRLGEPGGQDRGPSRTRRGGVRGRARPTRGRAR